MKWRDRPQSENVVDLRNAAFIGEGRNPLPHYANLVSSKLAKVFNQRGPSVKLMGAKQIPEQMVPPDPRSPLAQRLNLPKPNSFAIPIPPRDMYSKLPPKYKPRDFSPEQVELPQIFR